MHYTGFVAQIDETKFITYDLISYIHYLSALCLSLATKQPTGSNTTNHSLTVIL
ncbi:hypothetical protein VAEKB19_5180030 [Vibrio aestuarianus]|nr:hypothetical protein VAEKB19_5180030 [Vibrio aestuarianus]